MRLPRNVQAQIKKLLAKLAASQSGAEIRNINQEITILKQNIAQRNPR